MYRRGATDEDRARAERLTAEAQQRSDAVAAALEAVASGVDPGVEPGARAARRLRRPLVLGACVLVAAAVVVPIAALHASAGRPKPPFPQVASTPIALQGGPDERRADREDLDALFLQGPSRTIGLYLAQHRTALSVELRTDSIAVDGRSTGSRTFSLRGIENGEPTGLMSVLLTCDRRAAYSWVLTAPGTGTKPVRVGASGAECHGSVQLTTFVPKPGHVPTALHVTVPRGVRTIIEVDLSHY